MPMGKAAAFVEAYHFEMTELPTPEVEPGGILVKITSAGICGSDLHYWRGEVAGQPGAVILGHEMTGTVQTLGQGVTTDSMGRPLKEGDRVAYAYFSPCRRCYICLRGELNNCPNRFRFRASIEDYPYCSGLGQRYRLSERIRQSPEAYAEFGNDTAEAAASPRYRGAVREPAAAAVRQQDQEGC